jgi:hypothetical protein
MRVVAVAHEVVIGFGAMDEGGGVAWEICGFMTLNALAEAVVLKVVGAVVPGEGRDDCGFTMTVWDGGCLCS